MRFYKNRLDRLIDLQGRVRGISLLAVLVLCACSEEDLDYSFEINTVSVSRGYQSLNIRLNQGLSLSQQARDALESGVTLIIQLDLELRHDSNLIAVRRDNRSFRIRYLPLSERYQLSYEQSERMLTFPRLRHVLAAIDDIDVQLSTGPLPAGGYELRTRISLDESRLPAPMQLPAWLSSQWQHDSEWSVWPFEVNI